MMVSSRDFILLCSGPVRTIICGGIGGVSLWVAIFPFDVIKSRVQIQSADSPKNPPFVQMLVNIARQEGLCLRNFFVHPLSSSDVTSRKQKKVVTEQMYCNS